MYFRTHVLPTAFQVSSRFPWDPFPAPVTSSGEDLCSPMEHLPLMLGRNQAFPVCSQWVNITYLRLYATHTHTQLFYIPGSLVSILNFSFSFLGHQQEQYLQLTKTKLLVNHWFWYGHISKQPHHTPYTQHISIYASNAPCELRRNVLMDQTIACDVQSTFCRLLNISLARPSVGSPAHYRMLITSHQVTWNCWTALSYVCFHGKHQKAKPLHSWLRKD